MKGQIAESIYDLIILEIGRCLIGVSICFIVYFLFIIAIALIIYNKGKKP